MADPFIGEIRMFAGAYAPEQWRFCDGTVLPVSGNEALYSLVGNIYGGTAPSTFALPDLRGRVVVGSGPGPSLTPRIAGQSGGQETVNIDSTTMDAHNHLLQVNTAPATAVTASGNIYAQFTPVGTKHGMYLPNNKPGTAETFAAAMVMPTGSGATVSHDNRMPFMAINYIISMVGLYPTAA